MTKMKAIRKALSEQQEVDAPDLLYHLVKAQVQTAEDLIKCIHQKESCCTFCYSAGKCKGASSMKFSCPNCDIRWTSFKRVQHKTVEIAD